MKATDFSFDWRATSWLLIVVIVGMLAVWKPWTATTRTVSVTGSGTISAAPDEYTLNATYEKQAADAATATSQVAELGNGVVAKLKDLGLTDAQIRTTNGTQGVIKPMYAPAPTSSPGTEASATYAVVVTVSDKALAQKASDYLSTTPVQYAVSTSSTFSTSAWKKFQDQARTAALEDARAKASETASQLGVRLGDVKTVTDSTSQGGYVVPMVGAAGSALDSASSSSATVAAPTLEGGSQDVTFSVTATYGIR